MRRNGFTLLTLLIACSVTAAEPTTLPPGTKQPAISSLRLLDGSPAPTWKDLHGDVVIVDFWAAWCGPCVGAIPKMNRLEREFDGKPVRFLSVTYEPRAKVKAFLDQHPMSATVALDRDLATFVAWKAWGIPQIYLLDRNGTVVGVVHPDRLNASVIQALLDGKPLEVEQHPGWPTPAEAEGYFRSLLEEDRKKWGAD
jgi:thiol-disulfide isomerase/thioredoxin